MAENLLSDARVRSASHAKDGSYLADGGGLRIRLLPPSRNHAKGARLAEFHYKLKGPDGTYKNGALHLGTIGDPFTDSTGKTRPFGLADARQARDAARELVSKGVDPRDAARLADAEQAADVRRKLAELDGRRTVKQAFERWQTTYLAKKHGDAGQNAADIFERHVHPHVGEQPLEELRRDQVADLLDRLTSAGKNRTAAMLLQLLRQFVRWDSKRGGITHDPTIGLTKENDAGGKSKPRARALSQLEIVDLRKKLPDSALAPRIQHALWLILATGCRVGELSAARVSDFDLVAKVWTLPKTKNGSEHVVHLSEFAIEHLKKLFELRRKSAFLLPSRFVTIDDEPGAEREDKPIDHAVVGKMLNDRQRTKPLKGRTKASGALLLARGKWTPHDLRRTMATRMRQDLRISSDVVERCLNHKPQGIVAIYQTGELLAERKEAFEAWGAELERLMKLDVSNVVELGSSPAARAA